MDAGSIILGGFPLGLGPLRQLLSEVACLVRPPGVLLGVLLELGSRRLLALGQLALELLASELLGGRTILVHSAERR